MRPCFPFHHWSLCEASALRLFNGTRIWLRSFKFITCRISWPEVRCRLKRMIRYNYLWVVYCEEAPRNPTAQSAHPDTAVPLTRSRTHCLCDVLLFDSSHLCVCWAAVEYLGIDVCWMRQYSNGSHNRSSSSLCDFCVNFLQVPHMRGSHSPGDSSLSHQTRKRTLSHIKLRPCHRNAYDSTSRRCCAVYDIWNDESGKETCN